MLEKREMIYISIEGQAQNIKIKVLGNQRVEVKREELTK